MANHISVLAVCRYLVVVLSICPTSPASMTKNQQGDGFSVGDTLSEISKLL
jgi:hypothetical protein